MLLASCIDVHQFIKCITTLIIKHHYVDFNFHSRHQYKQAGTGPSRRHIQGSKIAKRLPSVKYSFTVVESQKFFEIFLLKKLHTKKMDRVARRGPLAEAPGALKSHDAEKLKGGPFEVFQHPFCRKTSKKMQGGPFEEKKFKKKSEKKCLAVPKKIERGDSLDSPGMICYAEKQVKPFWSSSLGQMVLFDTIIFCRTFKNYFGQFVWIEKKRVTIIVAFHFMKRRLKIHVYRQIKLCSIFRVSHRTTAT